MQITVKLHAIIRVGRFASASREYPCGTTIEEIMRELRIPERELGMIEVNGRLAEPRQLLRDGDVLSLFPLVGGVDNLDMHPFHGLSQFVIPAEAGIRKVVPGSVSSTE